VNGALAKTKLAGKFMAGLTGLMSVIQL